MSPHYKPPRLSAATLPAHVDKHTKLGFRVFEESITRSVNITNLSRLLGKYHSTLMTWIRVYADAHPDVRDQLYKTYHLEKARLPGEK